MCKTSLVGMETDCLQLPKHCHNPQHPNRVDQRGASAIWRTGNLWFAIGNHAAWDWGQTFLFGTPDSGLHGQHALMNPVPLTARKAAVYPMSNQQRALHTTYCV